MRKIFMLFVAILSFTVLSYGQGGESAFIVQGGYSWSYGMIGAEYQFNQISFGGGYMPTSMPGSGESLSSFSGVVTWYGGKWYESSYYTSLAFASAGYRSQNSYNGGSWTDDVVAPMGIWMFGYKAQWLSGLNMKAGAGVGWCSYATVFNWEVVVGWAFGN